MAPDTTDHPRPELSRVVSRWEVVALSINDVVGSGVYLLPAAAAMLLGPASVWAAPTSTPGRRSASSWGSRWAG